MGEPVEHFSPHQCDMFGEETHKAHGSVLGDKFLLPPFTVLNAREGWWQERKAAWLALGIQSEFGRGGGQTWGESAEITSPGLNYYRDQKKAAAND